MDCICALPTMEPTRTINDMPMPAMVEPMEQQAMGQVFRPAQALLHGTAFPELFKPMANQQLGARECRVDEEQAEAFLMWELRLYLNTHPGDLEALELLRKLAENCGGTYATAFLPCQTLVQADNACIDCRQYTWVDGPWPWERN